MMSGDGHSGLLERRVVAFIDILGFRDLMRRMEAEPELAASVHHVLLGTFTKEEGIYDADVRHVDMTTFSDCTVLSAPEGHEAEILSKLTYLTRDLMTNSILCRGAVVLGMAHHHERILFGPAIVDAYEKELHVARYPRIFVSDEVTARVQAADSPERRYHPARALVRDVDGCWFLDVFDGIVAADPVGKEVTFERIRESIRGGLHRAVEADRVDIVAKHRWLAARFNLTVRRHYEGAVPPIDVDRPMAG
jgi:hypothetical protein